MNINLKAYLIFAACSVAACAAWLFIEARRKGDSRRSAAFALLTAVVIVLGMRLMGALLISALIIFPALTSMRVFKSYKKVTVSAAILSAVCFVIGIFCSYTISIPVGATVVVINIIAFLIFFLIGKIRIRKQQ